VELQAALVGALVRQLALSQTPQPAHSSSARKRENTNVLTAARLDSSASRD
jgi:hypothetical protein